MPVFFFLLSSNSATFSIDTSGRGLSRDSQAAFGVDCDGLWKLNPGEAFVAVAMEVESQSDGEVGVVKSDNVCW